jgi:excisionase family DNA binding protein
MQTAAPVLLTIDETALALRRSRRSVARLVARGELGTVKIGGRRLVVVEPLREYIAARRVGGAAP